MRTRRLLVLEGALALTIISILLATGCDAFGGNGHALDGTRWRLVGWSVSAIDPRDFTTTAVFADGQISGSSAVNTFGGPYTTGSHGVFSVGEISQTLMAGPEPAMRAEQAYFALLTEAESYECTDGSLELSGPRGSLKFERLQP